jgi:hypothetical protein
MLNSDSRLYWGSDMGNAGGLPSDEIPWHGKPFSILITLPPLAVVYCRSANFSVIIRLPDNTLASCLIDFPYMRGFKRQIAAKAC